MHSDDSGYDDNFAEEYRAKQLKMLGELQSIYDDKSQLSQQIGLMINGGLSRDEDDSLGEAVIRVEEEHNDSDQIAQLLS